MCDYESQKHQAKRIKVSGLEENGEPTQIEPDINNKMSHNILFF